MSDRETPTIGISDDPRGPMCVCGCAMVNHAGATDWSCRAFKEVDGGPLHGGSLVPCPCTCYEDASIVAGLHSLLGGGAT